MSFSRRALWRAEPGRPSKQSGKQCRVHGTAKLEQNEQAPASQVSPSGHWAGYRFLGLRSYDQGQVKRQWRKSSGMTFQRSTKKVLWECKGNHFVGGVSGQSMEEVTFVLGRRLLIEWWETLQVERSQWAKVVARGIESLGTASVIGGTFCSKIKTADQYTASFVLNVD